MKSILRSILFYTVALYLVVTYIPGVKLEAGLEVIVGGGALLAVLFIIVKPILKIFTFPINFLTLGIFSGLINIIIIFLFVKFYPQVSIEEWVFEKFEYYGFIIPKLNISVFWTYAIVSSIITTITSTLNWLCD